MASENLPRESNDLRVVREIVEWLHTPDALWVIEKARREGVPEYAADRLAEHVDRTWGDMR